MSDKPTKRELRERMDAATLAYELAPLGYDDNEWSAWEKAHDAYFSAPDDGSEDKP